MRDKGGLVWMNGLKGFSLKTKKCSTVQRRIYGSKELCSNGSKNPGTLRLTRFIDLLGMNCSERTRVFYLFYGTLDILETILEALQTPKVNANLMETQKLAKKLACNCFPVLFSPEKKNK